MNTRSLPPADAEHVTHDELVLHALGRLPSRRREEVVAALARDPALAREARRIGEHLALYDRLPQAPEPPSFAALLPRLGAQQRSRRSFSMARVAAAIAAVVLVLVGAHLWHSPREETLEQRFPWVKAGPGLALAPWKDGLAELATSDEPAELRINDRTRVVLDRDSRLIPLTQDGVALVRGRAWLEVAPGAFSVAAGGYVVDVLGTAFELDVRDGLLVRVVEGRVRATAARDERVGEAGPGEVIDLAKPGAARAATEEGVPGSFARRPRLSLDLASESRAGETLEVRLAFTAPRNLAVNLPGPAPVASAAWLAFQRPDGTDATVGLDMAAAGPDRLLPGRSLTLAAGQRREIVFRVPLPPGPPGTWRLSALYRPEGEAALASEPVPLVVR